MIISKYLVIYYVFLNKNLPINFVFFIFYVYVMIIVIFCMFFFLSFRRNHDGFFRWWLFFRLWTILNMSSISGKLSLIWSLQRKGHYSKIKNIVGPILGVFILHTWCGKVPPRWNMGSFMVKTMKDKNDITNWTHVSQLT